jgi:putative transposase
VLAAVFVAEIGDITRFGKPEQLTSWAGLTPKHHESDTTIHRGRITKQGSKLVRWAAVEAVQRLPEHTRLGQLREQVAASYELFSSTEVLGRMALERMLAGLSTRRYPVGLEPVGTRTEQTARSTSRSAVSRRFVTATETALAQLLAADLSGLDLVALMVDGVHFGEHTCVVALGFDIDGTKHPLSVVEGSTENATLVTELIVGLRERGLDVTRPILAVLDGSKALRRAVLDVFDRPVIGRCQLHKIRNVQDRLPDKLRSVVAETVRSTRSCTSFTSPRLGATRPPRSISRERCSRIRVSGRRADATSDNSPTSSFGTCGTTPTGTPRLQLPTAWRPPDKIHLTRELRVDHLHLPQPCAQREALA